MTSRVHLKNWRSSENGAYTRKGTTLTVMVARRTNIIFDQMAASVLEIMDVPRNVKGKYEVAYEGYSKESFMEEKCN
jgi:hypothetical protein